MNDPVRIDVLALRAERMKTRAKEPPAVVVIGDTECPLPSEIPFDVLVAMVRMADNDMGGLIHAAKALLGPDGWETLKQTLPTSNDLVVIVEKGCEAILAGQFGGQE